MQRLGRHRVILDRQNNEPLLERYYIFLKDRKWFPFNMFIHKFLKGDPDDVHDHPWPYATLILKGGYYEWIPIFTEWDDQPNVMYAQRKVWRGPGHFRICKADSFHRIELKPGVTAWSLFIPGPHKKEWGFLVKGNKWIHNEEYLNNPTIRQN